MATHTTHTIDVATDADYTHAHAHAHANASKRPRSSWRLHSMPSTLPNDSAPTTDHHAALMHGHDHESISERTRHTHGDSTEDMDQKRSNQIGKMMTPYLAQHIPHQYNPQGANQDSQDAPRSTANTKYCYRHRPDLLCRRQADEPSMKELQDVCTVTSG
jgi:F-box/WD-40 domain protein MET30